MNVYPRQPLKAEHDGQVWDFRSDHDWAAGWTDAEFAEHFYPAERLDTLLAAVEAWVVADLSKPTEHAAAITNLETAFRAFREQVTA